MNIEIEVRKPTKLIKSWLVSVKNEGVQITLGEGPTKREAFIRAADELFDKREELVKESFENTLQQIRLKSRQTEIKNEIQIVDHSLEQLKEAAK